MGMTTTASGLQFEDTTVGTGAQAVAGKTCQMHYTGWLWVDNAKGKKFDSSLDRGDPFSFVLGAGQVIKGWDEGVAGMKIGGKRTLLIPSNLGYGARGAAGVIPPMPRCSSRSNCWAWARSPRADHPCRFNSSRTATAIVSMVYGFLM